MRLKLRKSGSAYCQGFLQRWEVFFFVIPSGPAAGLFCSLKTADCYLRVKQPKRESDHSPHRRTEVLKCTELYLHLPMRLHGLVLWQWGSTISSRALAPRRRGVENIVVKNSFVCRICLNVFTCTAVGIF
jgi:hypothetical protein